MNKRNKTKSLEIFLVTLSAFLITGQSPDASAQDIPANPFEEQTRVETPTEESEPEPQRRSGQPAELSSYNFGLSGVGYTPIQLDIMDTPYSYNQRNKAKEVLRRRLTLRHNPDGSPVYIRHCRHAEGGCEARINELVDEIFRVARDENIDPWLILAISFYETSFNPFDVGSSGAGGLMGLNPLQYRTIRFFWDREYRSSCINATDACQDEIIHAGVERLEEGVRTCNGDANAALRYYVSGTCTRNQTYARRVLRIRRYMLDEAAQVPDEHWCDPPRPICDPNSLGGPDPLQGLDLDI